MILRLIIHEEYERISLSLFLSVDTEGQNERRRSLPQNDGETDYSDNLKSNDNQTPKGETLSNDSLYR